MPNDALQSPDREQRLDEAVTAFLEEQESGRRPRREEWLARYPEMAAELEQFFADQDEVDRLTGPLRITLQSTPAEDTPCLGPPDGALFPFALSTLATPPMGYELLQVLGQGGMGLVYKARQESADRLVALKLIRAERLASESDVQRFRNEAEAAAQLDHPHIVPVYEVGARTGHCFFSMKLIEGGGLDGQLERFRDDVPGVARLVAQVARAVHHAHQRGILHRDLKPSNILLDGEGQPHISDFGLAKRMEADSSLTQTGAILGTPQYMAPEQASGCKDAVTTATDVYGLGTVLYALLTGKPPFQGVTVLETLEQVRQREPEPPRRSNAKVDRDLETICLKCLEKEPAKRYGSAEALAEDLERWLRGEAIQARRIGRGQRLWRWCRRNPFLATLSILSAGLALAFVAGLMVSLEVIVGQRDEVREQNKQIQEQDRRLRYHLYAGDMKMAYQAWKQGGLAKLDDLLERHRPKAGEDDLRTFVWYYLRRLADGLKPVRTLKGHQKAVFSLSFSPDGKTLATAGEDGTARLWDAQSGQEQLVIRASNQDIDCVAFSPDGRTLATAGDDGITRLWETATGRPLTQLHEHRGEVVAVVFSPDGKMLATAGEDGIVRLWDVASRKVTASHEGHKARIEALSFSPDGKNLISSGRAEAPPTHRWGKVISWDLTTQQGRTYLAQGIWVKAAAYSHDGLLAAFGDDDGQLHLWDAASERVQCRWRGHTGPIESVVFSPDDKLLASAGHEGVRVWDVVSHALRHWIPLPGDRAWCVKFSPDGRTLTVSGGKGGGANGTARLYNLAAAQPCEPPPTLPYRILGILLAPDGQTAAAGMDDCSIQTWNVATGELGPSCLGHQKLTHDMCFRADGKALLTASWDQTARIWDIATGKPLGTPMRHSAQVHSGDLSPDGALAITLCQGDARCWETASGEQRDLFTFRPYVRAVAISPDGKWVAAAVENCHVQLWDQQTRHLEHTFRAPRSDYYCVCTLRFNSDSTLLAAGYDSGTIQLWDTRTGQELQTLTGSRERSQFVVISPDGKTLASGSDRSPEIRLWDMRTGQEVASLEGHTVGSVISLAFTPDGTMLISAAGDGDGHAEIGRWSAPPVEEDSPRK